MDWSYIAGFFDGEGSVSMRVTKRGDMTRNLVWHNTHRESLEAMQAFMGIGTIYTRTPTGLGKKTQFALQISNKAGLLQAIDGMLPHLIIKREAAEALRQYLIDHVDEHRMDHFGAVAAISTEQLNQWYHSEGKSQGEIAVLLGVKAGAIAQAFRLRGLEARPAGGTSLKGRTLPDDIRQKMSATKQALWADPVFREKHIGNLAKGREAAKHRPKEHYLGGPPPGEAHPQAKLTDVQGGAIRTRYAEGAISLSKLAAEYAVSKKTILNIVHRKIWTHVP